MLWNADPFKSLDAVTTGTGSVIPTSNADAVRATCLFSGTNLSAGVVVIESAPTVNYSGTWAEIDRFSYNDADFIRDYGSGLSGNIGAFIRGHVLTPVAAAANPSVTLQFDLYIGSSGL